MPKALVIKNHTSKFSNPIKFSKGDVLKTGKTDDEYPGWIWCRSTGNREGRVPLSYIDIKDKTPKALVDYDATELNVKVGEKLDTHQEESGWVWCEKKTGETGWVPLEKLEIK